MLDRILNRQGTTITLVKEPEFEKGEILVVGANGSAVKIVNVDTHTKTLTVRRVRWYHRKPWPSIIFLWVVFGFIFLATWLAVYLEAKF